MFHFHGEKVEENERNSILGVFYFYFFINDNDLGSRGGKDLSNSWIVILI